MSHIAQDKRSVLEASINSLVNNLRELECDYDNNDMEANISYAIGRVLKAVYPGDRHSEVNAALGLLEHVKFEFYNRAGAQLSKQQEFDNGPL